MRLCRYSNDLSTRIIAACQRNKGTAMPAQRSGACQARSDRRAHAPLFNVNARKTRPRCGRSADSAFRPGC